MEENDQKASILRLTMPSSPEFFPPDVYKWTKVNAKPKMALKLMKVCKYFQHKSGFPFLVCKKASRQQYDDCWAFETLDNNHLIVPDLRRIPKDIWLIGMLKMYGIPRAASILLTKTAVCNFESVQLFNQIITMKEFMLLADGGNVEEFCMINTAIKNENGELAAFEDICDCLPNAKSMYIGNICPSISSLDAAKTKIPAKLEYLVVWFFPKSFDFSTFLAFMKGHQQIRYKLWFCGVTDEEYAQSFAPIVNKVVEEWSSINSKPKIKAIEEGCSCCYHSKLLTL